MLTLKRMLYPLLAHPRFTHVAKYVVYTGLVINGAFYMHDDYVAMMAALPADATALDYFTQIATSIDTVGWLGLVFLFELETYAVPEEKWTAWISWVIRSGRILCYLAIAGATYGYTVEGLEFYEFNDVPGVTSTCQMADQGIVMQLDQVTYSEVTTENCAGLSDEDHFYHIANEVSVVDEPTLHHLQFQGWVDIGNAYYWLAVVFLIEAELWFQNRDRFTGNTLNAVRGVKSFFYLLLIVNMFIWWYQGYYRYAWDAFLWIFGFWAIELNLAEWEVDRLEELQGT